LVVPLLWLYASAQAHDQGEWEVIFIISLSGFFIGLQNLGMMLSIMIRRFYPGLVAPLCETVGLLVGWLFCATAPAMAVTLLAARVVSVLIIWTGFRLERLPMAGSRDRPRRHALARARPARPARRAGGAAGPRRLRRARRARRLPPLPAAPDGGRLAVLDVRPVEVSADGGQRPGVHRARARQVRRMAMVVAAAMVVGATIPPTASSTFPPWRH
jgi:hypothetical protein